LLDQPQAAASRHQVIGHNHSNTVLQDADSGQRTFRRGGHGNLKTRISQYGFADFQLRKIVVDQ
jgi:hypothetical protein